MFTKESNIDQVWAEQLRSYAAEMDRTGRVPAAVWELLRVGKLFKLFVPVDLGGLMVTLPEAAQLFEDVARIEGNCGWLVTIGSGGGFFTHYMDPATAESVFSPAEALIAGSGKPTGTAIPTEGGYVVTGKWAYCSGAEQATCFTANAWLEGTESMMAFAFNPDQVEIDEDWDAFGLRATGSHSIVVRGAFVPHERTFSLDQPNGRFDYPIYRVPFLPFAAVSFAAVSAGIAAHLIEEAEQMAEERREEWHTLSPHRYQSIKTRIDEARNRLEVDREAYYSGLAAIWAQHASEQAVSPEEWDMLCGLCKKLSRTALGCGHSLMPYMGMQAVMQHHPINKVWRDLQTVCQHVVLVPLS